MKKGFTLIELMVAIVIVGILASIAVPKLFGHTAKAKASEVSPAASTYITLQKAYLLEHKGIGTWKKIGYEAPGKGETSNFKYSRGEVTSSVKQKNIKTAFSGEGKVAWMAENVVGLDNCHLGNKWTVSIVATSETSVDFKAQVIDSPTSKYCVALAGSDWGAANIQVAVNTPTPGESTPDPEPVIPETNEDEGENVTPEPGAGEEASSSTANPVLRECANSNSWLNGAKNGWQNNSHQDCYNLRVQLIESGALVCADKNTHKDNCNHFVYKDPATECEITGSNCIL